LVDVTEGAEQLPRQRLGVDRAPRFEPLGERASSMYSLTM